MTRDGIDGWEPPPDTTGQAVVAGRYSAQHTSIVTEGFGNCGQITRAKRLVSRPEIRFGKIREGRQRP